MPYRCSVRGMRDPVPLTSAFSATGPGPPGERSHSAPRVRAERNDPPASGSFRSPSSIGKQHSRSRRADRASVEEEPIMGYFDRKPTPKPAPLSTTGVSIAPAPRPATKFIKHTAFFLGVVALTTLLLSPRSRVFEWQRVLGYAGTLIMVYVFGYVLTRWWRDINERVPDTSTSALILGAGLIGSFALVGPGTWGGMVVFIALISLASLLGLISLFFPKLLLWFRDRFHLVFLLLYAIVIFENLFLFFGMGMAGGPQGTSWIARHLGYQMAVKTVVVIWTVMDLLVLSVSFSFQKLWRIEKFHLSIAAFCALTIGAAMIAAISH